ncbi:MAG: hypothetical protein NTX24_03190 [Candidatus Pacearchaeota archaeon]|nr:hypothetical protein [Candidatus Pacearchaeota archaeon]
MEGNIDNNIVDKTDVLEEKKEPITAISSDFKEEKLVKKSNKTGFNGFFKKHWISLVVVFVLLAIVLFSCYIRTENLRADNGSGLKDVTNGNYTLGPDLDPFLFLRFSRDIIAGNLTNPDMFRQAPLGMPNWANSAIQPWAIVAVYRVLSIFTNPPVATIEFAAIMAPVIFTAIATILFFLFIMVLFSFVTTKTRSKIGALAATALYVVLPDMLHRTVAGIPEVESLGMVWFWGAFLFFALAWKSEKIKSQAIFGLIVGLFTGLMIYTWGGFRYIFMTIGLVSFLIFLFGKQKKKNFLIFCSWIIPSFIFSFVHVGIIPTIETISDTGFGFIIFVILLIDMLIFNTKLKKIKEKINLPESIISILVVLVLGIIFLLILKPSVIPATVSDIVSRLIHPFGEGRVGLTVAENMAPYFVQVIADFSWLFWLFFFGVILLFYEATKHFNNNRKLWLNITFIIFLFTFIFSRFSSSSLLNGENGFSKFLYFGGLALFLITIIWIYIVAHIKKDEKTINDFKEINFTYLFLLAFSFWSIISMRGAIRLFFMVAPALVILAVFLPVKISDYVQKKDAFALTFFGVVLVLSSIFIFISAKSFFIIAFSLILVGLFIFLIYLKQKWHGILVICTVLAVAALLILTFVNNESSTVQQAKATINGPYYQQWQKAMAWVRTETSPGSIFVHWWDYGYWVQTLGERPTVTDGGHANGFWDHTTARYLMTAQNEKTALQLCKAYNVSYFILDSTDIGKYSAFASIGSDAGGKDRLSWISTFEMDEKQTQETKNKTIYVYPGGMWFDQDIVWKGQLLPMQKAGIAAFIITLDNKTKTFSEITAVVFYNQKRYDIPIKYYWINGQKYELDTQDSISTALYFIPKLNFNKNSIDPIGGALYLSEKALNTEWVKLYLLNETTSFNLVHTEQSLFVKQLQDSYGFTGEILLVNGDIQAPIKIWKVNYTKDIKYYPEYIGTTGWSQTAGPFASLDYLGT